MKTDKIKHFGFGAVVAFIVGIIVYLMQQDDAGNVADSAAWAGAFVALACSAVAGAVKEWCDSLTHKWDWYDLLATCIGGLAAALLIIGIHFC